MADTDSEYEPTSSGSPMEDITPEPTTQAPTNQAHTMQNQTDRPLPSPRANSRVPTDLVITQQFMAEDLAKTQKRPVGQETDPVVRTYGQLGEGIWVYQIITAELSNRMKARYHRRRNLAELGRFPEGYEFRNELVNGHQQAVILLTPPDQIAVRQADGTWIRRMRLPQLADGPAPYSDEWWFSYLVNNNLPLWFMTREHLAMVDSQMEAQMLSTVNRPSFDPLPPINYLDVRYPAAPLYPVPDVHETNEIYGYELAKSDIKHLAKRFPAVIANAMNNEYRIYVTPSGHIITRYYFNVPNGALEGNEKQLSEDSEWLPESADRILASYGFADGGASQVYDVNTRPTNRTAAINQAIGLGRLVDPHVLPNGLGTWHFLDDNIDLPIARALHLPTPVDVVRSRMIGGLRGMRRNDRPIVVFIPDARYRNPTRQPLGPGRWEYLTEGHDGSEQALAWMNFGGQGYFGPNDIDQPTAADIWRLRQEFRREIARGDRDEDRTESIDLVWVPMTPEEAEEAEEDEEEDEDDGHEEEGAPSTDSDDPDVIDHDSGVKHAPLNRGENDQTGPRGARTYQSRKINGKVYTVDRSRSHAGVVEPRKAWAVTSKGKWQRYNKYNSLDWNDKTSIEKMNKWREQTFTRSGWPLKRKMTRERYSKEQRTWLEGHVKDREGDKPTLSIKEITDLFNQRFQQKRNESGIATVLDRLKKKNEPEEAEGEAEEAEEAEGSEEEE